MPSGESNSLMGILWTTTLAHLASLVASLKGIISLMTSFFCRRKSVLRSSVVVMTRLLDRVLATVATAICLRVSLSLFLIFMGWDCRRSCHLFL